MTWTQVQDFIEVTDYEPPRAVRVKKMIWSDRDQAFETHYFIRVNCENAHQAQATQEWLLDQFGDPQYQGTWWRDPGRSSWIWLADSIATFWQLKYGGQP